MYCIVNIEWFRCIDVYQVSLTSPLSQWFEIQRSTAQAERQKKLRYPIRPTDDVLEAMKGLQKQKQLNEWNDAKDNKDNSNFDSNSIILLNNSRSYKQYFIGPKGQFHNNVYMFASVEFYTWTSLRT